MRYDLPVDVLVNRLVPHFLSGRRFILFVQSCLYPLQNLNSRFCTFTRERHIEARMTSQVIYFEWYLNYKFGRYLQDSRDRITLGENDSLGVDIYHENAKNSRPYTVWYNGEQIPPIEEEDRPRPMYRLSEEKSIGKVSFIVCVPPLTIPIQEAVYMISYAVNRYRAAGKSFLICIDNREYEPNNNTNR